MSLFARKTSLIIITIFFVQFLTSCNTSKLQSGKANYISHELAIAQVNTPKTNIAEETNKLEESASPQKEKNLVLASTETKIDFLSKKKASPEKLFAGSKKVYSAKHIAKDKIKKKQSENLPGSPVQDKPKGKNQWLALILALFLGAYGVHRFYLGHTKSAVLMLTILILAIMAFIAGLLLIPFFSTPIVFLSLYTLGFILALINSIWMIIDIVNILTGKLQPKDGEYGEKIDL